MWGWRCAVKVCRVAVVVLALCGVSWPVLGQSSAPFATPPPGSPPTAMRPYGEAAGCPEEPALFHPCAIEKATTFDPPRTPDGTPDFQGMWGRFGIRNMENIQEHPETTRPLTTPADGAGTGASGTLSLRARPRLPGTIVRGAFPTWKEY